MEAQSDGLMQSELESAPASPDSAGRSQSRYRITRTRQEGVRVGTGVVGLDRKKSVGAIVLGLADSAGRSRS